MAFNNDNDAMGSALNQAGRRQEKSPGMIETYLEQNAHPNAGGWHELNKLHRRTIEILDRVAITMRGKLIDHKKNSSLEPLEDLFNKEYWEQFTVNDRELVLSVGFGPNKVLRLALTDVTPKPEPVKEESQDQAGFKTTSNDSFMGKRSNFEPDYIFGIKAPRESQFGNSHGLMACDGYRETIGALSHAVETFSVENNLAFYVQGGPSKDRLVYIFIDNDSVEG